MAFAVGLLALGCHSGAPSQEAEAEMAADQTQGLISDYYANHGVLPSSDLLTSRASKQLAAEMRIDPTWTFSCRESTSASPTLAVSVSVSGPTIKGHTFTYDLDETAYRLGMKHRK